MVLEVRNVRDRVAFDGPREARRGVRREATPKRLRSHRRVLIEIPERVDGRRREAGSRR
jgi:hypothetical protein